MADMDRNGVQVIRRAARILQSLKNDPDGISLSKIAERTELPRSTVHRLVGALESEGLVVTASANGRYRLGPAIPTLAVAAERNFALDYHPYLVELSREVDETVDLGVLEYDHVRFVHQVAAPRRLRAVSSIGAVCPAYCTANGKALLAREPVEHVARLLPERLERLTPNTITNRHQLLAELGRVRAQGIAIDREEHTIGICAIGVAVEDADGNAVAITVPLPAARFADGKRRIIRALLATRDTIERSLRPASA